MSDFMSSVGVGSEHGTHRAGGACRDAGAAVAVERAHCSGRTATGARPASARAMGAAALVAALATTFMQGETHAALIATWNLNSLADGAPPVVSASTGSGMLDCTGLGGGYGVMQGTTLGTQAGELAGNALAIVGSAFNQSAIQIDLGTVTAKNIMMSFAVRRSSTGFASNRIDYWTGFSWIAFANFGASTTAWELQSHSLNIVVPPASGTLSLRIVVDGATGSTGSIRFDNIAVSGTPVPSPAGALALLGLAGCVSRRRR